MHDETVKKVTLFPLVVDRNLGWFVLAEIERDQPRNISISKVDMVTATPSIDGNRIDIKSNTGLLISL